MAMDEEVRAPRLGQAASEGQELFDIAAFRRDAARAGVDNVVKAQLEPPMRVEAGEGLGLGPAGIEDRQDMGDARLTMRPEFIDPTNCQLERHQAL